MFWYNSFQNCMHSLDSRDVQSNPTLQSECGRMQHTYMNKGKWLSSAYVCLVLWRTYHNALWCFISGEATVSERSRRIGWQFVFSSVCYEDDNCVCVFSYFFATFISIADETLFMSAASQWLRVCYIWEYTEKVTCKNPYKCGWLANSAYISAVRGRFLKRSVNWYHIR